ncbi:hypothetical protein VP01_412g5 [Puccinia sorghi]|uniref:Uncharacterized protein n=1 Tax=Puccinia sorghi TaxID=27349 RepID=A0A0L6UR65_9BASI|nr:hypothetical protein VP01_412g5 [Puccinia sorghi]
MDMSVWFQGCSLRPSGEARAGPPGLRTEKSVLPAHRIAPEFNTSTTMISLLRSVAHQYDRWFRRSPLLTLAVANGICSILGDSAAQLISIWNATPDKLVEFNYFRIMRYLLYGINMGPISGKWNEFLERQFPPRSRRETRSNNMSGKPPSPIELIEVNSTISTSQEDSSKSLSRSVSKADSSGNALDLVTILKMVVTADFFFSKLVLYPRDRSISHVSYLHFICFMGFTEGSHWEVIYARLNRLFWKLLLANWQVWPIIQLINFKFMPLRLRSIFCSLRNRLDNLFELCLHLETAPIISNPLGPFF